MITSPKAMELPMIARHLKKPGKKPAHLQYQLCLWCPREGDICLSNSTSLALAIKSPVTFLIKGTLAAPLNRSEWNDKNRRLWIVFDSVRNLVVKGGGTINGNGHIWWQNSCKRNKTLPCIGATTALTFVSCNYLRVKNLRIKDSQQFHVVVKDSREVKLSKLFIHAPEKSPNTDGIHLDHASNVVIRNCEIRTGLEAMFADLGYFSYTAIQVFSPFAENLTSVRWPVLAIAILAVVVGSQSIISGTFSIKSICSL